MLLAALSLGGTAAFAQSPILNPFGGAPAPPERGGFYLYNVAVFGQYSSSVVPLSYAFTPGSAALGSDEAIGGSAMLGWSHPGPKGQLSLYYSPSYIGMVHYSGLNSFNQTLSFSASRRLSPRWNFGFSAAANDSTLAQYLFAPTVLSNVASVPATASDLNTALLNGIPQNNQLASLLTGAPLAESAANAALYGMRVLTATGQASLAYAYSPRLSIRIGFNVLRLQDLPSQGTAALGYVLPKSTSGSVNTTILYRLSPRTQTGVSTTATRTFSRFADAYITMVTGFAARTLSPHWFVQGQAGIGTITLVGQQQFAVPAGPEYIAGGSVGYKKSAHTLVASVTRTTGDAYAYGAGYTLTTQAVWNWHRRGSPWALYGSSGQQRFYGLNSGNNVTAWISTAGFSRALSAQLGLQAQYAFLKDSLAGFGVPNSISIHSVRVALVWSPMAHLWR